MCPKSPHFKNVFMNYDFTKKEYFLYYFYSQHDIFETYGYVMSKI